MIADELELGPSLVAEAPDVLPQQRPDHPHEVRDLASRGGQVRARESLLLRLGPLEHAFGQPLQARQQHLLLEVAQELVEDEVPGVGTPRPS